MVHSKRTILFDLDGVLLDSRPNMEFAWSEVRSRMNLPIPFESYFKLIGRPFADIMNLLGETGRAAEIERIFRVSSMEGIELARFYPGTEETLLCLARKGYKLGVVTSKDRLRTSAILAKLTVEFVSVQTPENRYRGKPAPDHLLLAMAEACCDPSECLYIGDMSADFEAAQRAGVDYIHAGWGYGQRPSPHIAELTSICELPTFLGA